MTASEAVHLYFELSNQGNLSDIEKLLMDDATYSSDATGLHYGKADIMNMMSAFFDSYTHLHWEIRQLKEISAEIIQTEFACQLTDNNITIEKTGIENIIVVDSLIRHIEVRNRPQLNKLS